VLRLLTFGGLAAVARADDGTSPRIGPRRLAILAVVAAAGEAGITRDRLIGLFWPESSEEHGRHSLRQALYALREEAGPVLRQGANSLSLDPQHISSDLGDFRAALARGDLSEAANLYRGPFLDGFYLSGMDEFERWVTAERNEFSDRAATALRALASQATAAGDHAAATSWWERLARLEPLSGRTAVALARALAATGDRARALASLHAHEQLVRRELDTAPDAEVSALAAELRRSAPSEPMPTTAPQEAAPSVAAPALDTEVPRPPARRPSRAVIAMVALVVVAAVLVGRWWMTRLPDVGTRSPVALGFYEEGLENYRLLRIDVAQSLMSAALREDSAFAMPAYYLALMATGEGWEERQRALRLAEGAPPRQRMQIRADLQVSNHDPAAVATVREWVAAYPDDGEAFLALGRALHFAGDFAGSVAALERALVLLDRADEAPGTCLLCEPFDRLTQVYFWWDSLLAVERTARRQLARYPERHEPLRDLALAAARAGDSVRAQEHLRQLTAATASADVDPFAMRIFLTLERYEQVETITRRLLASANPHDVTLGQWMLGIALRNQGRLEDAHTLVRTGWLPGLPSPAAPPDPDYTKEAILAFEGGDPARAAALFEIQRGRGVPRTEGMRARWLAWHSALGATALAAAGDTASVRRMVDTVAYWGARSLYGRDQRLHHFVRGLLLAAEKRDAEAVGAYREAIHSPSLGYTRINLELARALLRMGRAAEAVPVLQAALRGEVDASNLYVTRTELHEVLAEAFERAGQADSARVHWQAVASALARSDASFSGRRTAAADALRRLGGSP